MGRIGRDVVFPLLTLSAALAGCVTPPPPDPRAPPTPTAPPLSTPSPSPRSAAPLPKASPDRVVARNERFVIYKPHGGDTLRSIAQDYLGNADRYWEIADFNGVTAAEPDQMLVIPLRPGNPIGVFANGYQTVPILAYHRFGQRESKMEVSV